MMSLRWIFTVAVAGILLCLAVPGAAQTAATGNIASEDLLYMLDRSGVATGVSLESLIATTKWLQQQLGRESPGMLHKAGGFPKRALQ